MLLLDPISFLVNRPKVYTVFSLQPFLLLEFLLYWDDLGLPIYCYSHSSLPPPLSRRLPPLSTGPSARPHQHAEMHAPRPRDGPLHGEKLFLCWFALVPQWIHYSSYISNFQWCRNFMYWKANIWQNDAVVSNTIIKNTCWKNSVDYRGSKQ